LLLLGWACQEHKHIIVLHSGLFQCFRIWLEDGVVEVELLLLLREVGLGVDEGFEIEDGKAGWQVKVEELLVEGMVGCDDRYGNSGPRQNKHRWSVLLLRWHRTGLTVRRRAGETARRGRGLSAIVLTYWRC
jgi:hypothetical protein